jgi:hypothetical protein
MKNPFWLDLLTFENEDSNFLRNVGTFHRTTERHVSVNTAGGHKPQFIKLVLKVAKTKEGLCYQVSCTQCEAVGCSLVQR